MTKTYKEKIESGTCVTVEWNGEHLFVNREHAVSVAAEADAEIARLKAENERLRVDAERYRWLKSNAEVSFREHQWFHTSTGQRIHSTHPNEDELDEAIDAARQTGEQK